MKPSCYNHYDGSPPPISPHPLPLKAYNRPTRRAPTGSNKSQLTSESDLRDLRKIPEVSTGFEPMSSAPGAMLYQLGYEALLEAGQEHAHFIPVM